jgi:Uma2 family endonuclease
MYEKEQLCMAHGCQEFWVIDPDKRYVPVALANGPTTTYHPGEHIPLKVFGDASLSIDDLFA